jgi:hypothetical protein
VNIDGEIWCTEWGQQYGKMRSEARIGGLLKALRAVLRVRGLDPTEAQWTRLEGCRSTKQLLRYIARAAIATKVGQVFRRFHDDEWKDPFDSSKIGVPGLGGDVLEHPGWQTAPTRRHHPR